MVSHFWWKNSQQILAWARQGKAAGLIRQKDYFGKGLLKQMMSYYRKLEIPAWMRRQLIGDGYFIFTDLTGDVEPLDSGILTKDGHCSYSPDGRWILTDTYPDKNNQRTLILYQPGRKRRVNIGQLYQPSMLGLSALRCDLHPRWSRDGTQVCIDSTHEGSRQMYVLDVKGIVCS